MTRSLAQKVAMETRLTRSMKARLQSCCEQDVCDRDDTCPAESSMTDTVDVDFLHGGSRRITTRSMKNTQLDELSVNATAMKSNNSKGKKSKKSCGHVNANDKQESRRITRSRQSHELNQVPACLPSVEASVTPLAEESKPQTPKKKSSSRIIEQTALSKADEPEIWDLVRHAYGEKTPCSTKGCKERVVAVWASDQNPKDEWFTCEVCQKKDFGGWPEDELPLSKWTPSAKAKRTNSKNNPNNSSIKKRSCGEKDTGSRKDQSKTKKHKTRLIDNSVTLTGSKRTHRANQASQPSPMQQSPLSLRANQDGQLMQQVQNSTPVSAKLPSPIAPRPRPRVPSNDVAAGPQTGVPNLPVVAERSEPKSKSKSTEKRPSPMPPRPRPRAPSNDVAAKSKSTDRRVMARIRRRKRKLCARNAKNRNTWTGAEVLHSIPNNSTPKEPFSYDLRRGGNFKVFPNVLEKERLANIAQEILNCGLFRQYSVQAQDEPRLHFLAHEKATDDFADTQPGYSYAQVSAKARPLKKLPLLEALAKELADKLGVKSWNIGVNPVLYRGSNDSMGEHADDDQGEELILCLVVSSPKGGARRVRISPKAKGSEAEDEDECIDLMMSEGDAYLMDGKMQEFYFHSVPKTKDTVATDDGSYRLSIVFRTGRDCSLSQDSGQPCEDLAPKVLPSQVFGKDILGLSEGRLYSRLELFNMGAHRMQQRGISGNMKAGADAMIVSGLRQDGLGCDRFHQLVYAVERKKGGVSVKTSFDKSLPIRVFRSSNYDESPYKATSMDDTKLTSTRYRYDGLYEVVKYCEPLVKNGPYFFELHRLDSSSSEDIDESPNEYANRDVLEEYTQMGTIQVQQQYRTAETSHDLIQNVVDEAIRQNELLKRNENPPLLNASVRQMLPIIESNENPPLTNANVMQMMQI